MGTRMLLVEREGDRGFKLVGEVDVASAVKLLAQVGPAAEEGGDVILDLSQLEFVDSSGIRALVVLAEKLRKRGRLILLAPPRPVLRTLDIVRIREAPNIEIFAG